MSKALLAKIEKLSSAKGTFPDEKVMSLTFAAEELRDSADGDPKLLAAARKALECAAEKGDPNAALSAADMWLEGLGGEVNLDTALELYEKAAELGNWLAALKGAKMHFAHTKNWKRARSLAGKAAEEHSPTAGAAHYLMGLLAWHGHGEPKDMARAVKQYQRAAKLEDADAMFELYVLYSTGQGVERDDDKAMSWCKKAAELGQHRACFNLGAAYATGNGVKKNEQLSRTWYQRAADEGNGRAAATLAAMALIENGPDGVPEAMSHVARAIELQFDVGALLLEAGVPAPIVENLLELTAPD